MSQLPTSNMLRVLADHHQVKISVIVFDVGVLPQKIESGISPQIEQAVQIAAEKIATRFSLEHL